MAKSRFGWRGGFGLATAAALRIVQWGGLALAVLAGPARAQEEAPAAASAAGSVIAAGAAPAPQQDWARMPRLNGRITAHELGLVINTADPYSVAVGEYYASRRGIPEAHVVRVNLPLRPRLTVAEFDAFNAHLHAHMPATVQGLALAWNAPYAVECNSITAALAMGFQAGLCANSCAPSRPSLYFSYAGSRPFTELGMRLSMLLASRTVESAKALIDRGVAADHSLPDERAPVNAFFVSTPDGARNVRATLFPPAGPMKAFGVDVQRPNSARLPPLRRALIYQTGLERVPGIDNVAWMPGALADHLTSNGGNLENAGPPAQMSAVEWLEAGATASYGTVTEPCNHRQKFPHPQALLLSYIQGVSALEAYWHSVAWPAQGVFIGEPLAAPFAPR